MSLAEILFNDAEPFEQIVNTLLTKASMRNLVKTFQAISEKRTLKYNTILYMCIAQEHG